MNFTFETSRYSDNSKLAVCKLDEYLESVISIINSVDPKYKKLINTILTTKVLTPFNCKDVHNSVFVVIDYDLLKTVVQGVLSEEDHLNIKKNNNFNCYFLNDTIRYTKLIV